MVVKNPRSKSSSKDRAARRTAELAMAAKLFEAPGQKQGMAAAAALSNKQQVEEEEKRELVDE